MNSPQTNEPDPVLRYLAAFEKKLKRKAGVSPEEALEDAREHLTSEADALRQSEPGLDGQEIYARLIQTFGIPEDIAEQYRDAAKPVTKGSFGLAPGWRICCPKCGRSAPLAETGTLTVRRAARSRGLRRLGWCRECRWFRWLKVVRDLDSVTLTPKLEKRSGKTLLPAAVLVAAAIGIAIAVVTAADQTAPKIVETVPKNGAGEVSAKLEQVTVTFDRDMDQGGFSFVGGGPTFPETTGKPFWKDKRTCVLPVRLKPGSTYTIGINSARFQNFKSAGGVAAEPVVLKFTAAGKAKPITAKAAQVEAIQKLKTAIDTRYSYKDVRKADWPKLWKQFEPRLRAAKSAEAFAATAGEMLAETKDPHIWLKVGGRTVPGFRRDVTPNANFNLLPEVIDGWKQHGKTGATGMAAPDVGYLAIFSWSNQPGPAAYEVLYKALEKFADLPGIIVDARINSGGNELIAREFAGCFLKQKSLYAKHATIGPGGFGKPSERWIEPSGNRSHYSGKIAVLTGPYVMSSAEGFLLMMKQAPNAKLIGAPSYGSSGNPQPHDLGNGVTVPLPSWKAMLPDGTVFEGKGIQPDIAVETKGPSDFKSRDPVIERALEWLHEGN